MVNESVTTGESVPAIKQGKPKRARTPKAKAPPQPANYFSKEGAQMVWDQTSRTMQRSGKLFQKSASRVQKGLKKEVKKRPIESLLAGLGVGLFGALAGILFGTRRSQSI